MQGRAGRCADAACGAARQGLGFPDLTNMQTLPAFFNMIHQGVLDAPTFAIYLNPDPAQEPSGQIEFGGYNTAHFVGPLNWAPVVDKACATRPSAARTVQSCSGSQNPHGSC